CHDHKFDPLAQSEYYGLFAFFNQTPVEGGGGDPQSAPNLAAPTAEQKPLLAAAEQTLAEKNATVERRASELSPGQAEWERGAAAAETAWTRLTPTTLKAEHQTLVAQADGLILASGENPTNDTYTITAPVELDRLTGIQLEAQRHPSMTAGGLARSDSGNFVLTEIEIILHRPDAEPQLLKFTDAKASFSQGGFSPLFTFDGNAASGWAVYDGGFVNRDHRAVWRVEPVAAGPGSYLTITLRHDSIHKSHNLGYFRLSVSAAEAPGLSDRLQLAPEVATALAVAAERRTPEQAGRIRAAFLESDSNYRQAAGEQKQAKDALDSLQKQIAKVMVMADRPEPRKTFVLSRGIYSQPQQEVTAGTPAALVPLPADAPHNRLGLARWLVSPQQPLVARVTVNRLWQQVFGIGLVKTVEDFGSQAEIPRYLDLLDFLAADFRDSGWDTKRLLRSIVTSRTYRQSSRFTGNTTQHDAAQHDPDNRWLARGARYRLPSWMLRDQALAAAGLLVRRQGGPPVRGYQPAGVWEEATFGNKRYEQEHGEALYRRSLYTFWRRIVGPTEFFDNASRQTCTVKLVRTNTPLQALLTLNDTTFVEAARALAQRVLSTDAEPAARLDEVFRRLLARRASEAERTILLAGLERSRAEFRADPKAALALLAVGESPRDEKLEPAEHAAWTALALAVLNFDETLSKE
ncbi:MAG TPA: DUF1553 domain-containing protein, partial [Pirellulales bacterium]|nr:DUF1553 domain-containing protein [Pirellulales bacterium]